MKSGFSFSQQRPLNAFCIIFLLLLISTSAWGQGKWIVLSNMPGWSGDQGGAAIQGKLYVIFGTGNEGIGSAFCYDPNPNLPS